MTRDEAERLLKRHVKNGRMLTILPACLSHSSVSLP